VEPFPRRAVEGETGDSPLFSFDGRLVQVMAPCGLFNLWCVTVFVREFFNFWNRLEVVRRGFPPPLPEGVRSECPWRSRAFFPEGGF